MAKTPITVKAIVSQTYISIRDRIKTLMPDHIKEVGRWNNQPAMEKFEHQLLLPACWIELLPVTWDYTNWERRKGPLIWRLHQCVQTIENFEIEDWEFNQKIFETLQGWEIPATAPHTRPISIGELINHNYNVYIDNQTDYRTFVHDETLFRLRNTGTVKAFTEIVTVAT